MTKKSPHARAVAFRVTYAETYRAHSLRIKAECLPTLPSATGFVVDSAYITKAGHVEVNGTPMEFQDVRIYLKEGATT